MKRALSAITIAASLLFISACSTPGSSVPEETSEYKPDGTVTTDIRSIDGDVYASIASESNKTTPEEIESILEDTKGAVTEDHSLYIDVFDLSDEYQFEGETKYRAGYPSEAVDKVLGDEYEWSYDDDRRVTIPFESLEAYYN